MIINSQIKRYSITLVNEDKLYGIKPQRFEKLAVELNEIISLRWRFNRVINRFNEGLTLETRQLHIANRRIEKVVTGLFHKSLTSLQLLNNDS